MATEKQNHEMHTWFQSALQLNDQSIVKMTDLYEHYCDDLRYKNKRGINVSLPVRPKAFATSIKKYARIDGINGKVIFFYLRESQVQGWEYVHLND